MDAEERSNRWWQGVEPEAPHTSLIVLHGIGANGQTYVDGDGGAQPQFAGLPFLKAAGVELTRVVFPSAALSTAAPVLKALEATGKGDGKTAQPSWVNRAVAFENDQTVTAIDWVSADNAASVAYVHSLIRKEISRGIASSRVFLMCHGQGGCVGAQAALTFPDAPLGGLIMLSAFHGSPELHAAVAAAQKPQERVSDALLDTTTLPDDVCRHIERLTHPAPRTPPFKALVGLHADDEVVPRAAAKAMADAIKKVVGEDHFRLVEEEDNPKEARCHAPFVPSMAQPVADFLKHVDPTADTLGAARGAGSSCKQARDAGYTCRQVQQAGYTCLEATEAGYEMGEIHKAKFTTHNIRCGSCFYCLF